MVLKRKLIAKLVLPHGRIKSYLTRFRLVALQKQQTVIEQDKSNLLLVIYFQNLQGGIVTCDFYSQTALPCILNGVEIAVSIFNDWNRQTRGFLV